MNNVYATSIVLTFDESDWSDITEYNNNVNSGAISGEEIGLKAYDDAPKEKKADVKKKIMYEYNKAHIKHVVKTILENPALNSVINIKESKILFTINGIQFVVTNGDIDVNSIFDTSVPPIPEEVIAT